MIVEPFHKQCLTVQKLGLNVKKLEEVTMEAMNNWFNDPEHPENNAKKPFLREIFKVAKVEERYKNGEIGESTEPPNQTLAMTNIVLIRWRHSRSSYVWRQERTGLFRR